MDIITRVFGLLRFRQKRHKMPMCGNATKKTFPVRSRTRYAIVRVCNVVNSHVKFY